MQSTAIPMQELDSARAAQSRLDRSKVAPDRQRIESFGRALDALRRELEADLGERDLAYIRRVRSASRRLEIAGRSLIHFSLEPLGFALGVGALSVHKLLETIEIGHTVLHGTYDRFECEDGLRSQTFRWKTPIHEQAWRNSHNIQHHQYTNVSGRDPDMDFGVLRLTEQVSHRGLHALQPLSNVATWLVFCVAINAHATGLIDVCLPARNAHALKDRSWRSIRAALRAGIGKPTRYYTREYVFFPLLAGPFFWKTLLGNVLSEVGKDFYTGATIYCGHVGAQSYGAGAQAKGRAQWYAMQVEASRDFEVPAPFALLCGGLERQIEHHLFPRLPPNRLREIAPRVRAICEEHGVTYRTCSWPATLRDVLRSLHRLNVASSVISPSVPRERNEAWHHRKPEADPRNSSVGETKAANQFRVRLPHQR
jgi:fatty acid desaturase